MQRIVRIQFEVKTLEKMNKSGSDRSGAPDEEGIVQSPAKDVHGLESADAVEFDAGIREEEGLKGLRTAKNFGMPALEIEREVPHEIDDEDPFLDRIAIKGKGWKRMKVMFIIVGIAISIVTRFGLVSTPSYSQRNKCPASKTRHTFGCSLSMTTLDATQTSPSISNSVSH